MPLRLAESDERLTELCRHLERAVDQAGILVDIDLNILVDVVPNFDDPSASGYDADLPTAVREIYRMTPAGYRASQGKVVVNASMFFSSSGAEQEGIIAHELGHAIGHQTGAADWRSEIEADLMACRLGYYNEIRNERVAKHPHYVEGLAQWRNVDEARVTAKRGLERDMLTNLIG